MKTFLHNFKMKGKFEMFEKFLIFHFPLASQND